MKDNLIDAHFVDKEVGMVDMLETKTPEVKDLKTGDEGGISFKKHMTEVCKMGVIYNKGCDLIEI